jgi:hypothetical protein
MIQEAFAQWGHTAFLDPVLADWLEEQGEQLLAEAVRVEQSCAVRYIAVTINASGSGGSDGYGDGSGCGSARGSGRGHGDGQGHSHGISSGYNGADGQGHANGSGDGDGGGRAD